MTCVIIQLSLQWTWQLQQAWRMDLYEFLKGRHVSQAQIQSLLSEKIDEEVITLMSEDELSKFLPHQGDRIAVRSFAQEFRHRQSGSDRDLTNREQQKPQKDLPTLNLMQTLSHQMKFESTERNKLSSDTEQLLENIRIISKMNPGKASKAMKKTLKKRPLRNTEDTTGHATCNKKEDISISIGLSVFTGGKYKQVRCQNAGGISHCRLVKPVTKVDILNEAISSFFPEGTGGPGNMEDFIFDVASDVAGTRKFYESETAEDFMKRLRQKKMRCYLLAKPIDAGSSNDDDDDEELQTTSKSSREGESHASASAVVDVDRDKQPEGDSSIDLMDEALMATESLVVQNPFLPNLPSQTGQTSKQAVESTQESLNHSASFLSQSMFEGSQAPDDLEITAVPMCDAEVTIPAEFIEEDFVARAANDSNEVSFNPRLFPELHDTLPLDSDVKDESVSLVRVIEVHRGLTCRDLIAYFQRDGHAYTELVTYEVKMLKEDGTEEIAEDNGGVIRDALTEFWDTFYLQYTVGNIFKVPWIRHDMSEKDWQAVAMVLVLGYKQERIFPIKLASTFMEHAIFGVTTDTLRPFLKYVAEMDRVMLETALNEWESVDEEDLLDFLERYEAKKVARKANIGEIVRELGHKEIVQKPSWVAERWREILCNLNLTVDMLNDIYNELQPTAKKVMKILVFPENMNVEETTLSYHLKRLIREFDLEVLGLFLRFCTGTDMMVKNAITIRFIRSDSSDNVRSPTSHTCGCILELPVTYGKDPYVSFKSEFSTLLRNRYWQMDIV